MTAEAEALTGKFSLNDARNGRRENNFGATITTVQSAACNSVVLAYEFNFNEKSNLVKGYENDRKDNVLTVRLQYKF